VNQTVELSVEKNGVKFEMKISTDLDKYIYNCRKEFLAYVERITENMRDIYADKGKEPGKTNGESEKTGELITKKEFCERYNIKDYALNNFINTRKIGCEKKDNGTNLYKVSALLPVTEIKKRNRR